MALRSLNALCAALFCAFLLDAGVSTLGFLPGLGLGGKTHSFDVIIRVTLFVVKLLAVVLFGGDVALLLWMLGLAALLGVEPAEAEDGGEPAIAIGDWATDSCLGAILGPFVDIYDKFLVISVCCCFFVIRRYTVCDFPQ